MKKLIIILNLIILIIIFVGCPKTPELPIQADYNNQYDSLSKNFNDELFPGTWDIQQPFRITDQYLLLNKIFNRILVPVEQNSFYLLGGTDIVNGNIPSNQTILFTKDTNYQKTIDRIDSIYFNKLTGRYDTVFKYKYIRHNEIELGKNMLLERNDFTASSVFGNIYVIGGNISSASEYLSNNNWYNFDSLIPRKFYKGSFSVNYNNNIIIGGGIDISNSNINEIYKLSVIPPIGYTLIKQFSNLPSFSTAQIVNDELYIIGGFDKNGIPLSSILIYNFENQTLRNFQDTLKVPRGKAVSCVRKGRIYIFGGITYNNALTNFVEEIKITNNKCVSKEPFPNYFHPDGAVLLFDNQIYLVGYDESKNLDLQFYHFYLCY